MKYKEIEELGVQQEIMENVFINPLAILCSDELNKKSDHKYSKRALKRALKAKKTFVSEFNAHTEVVKATIQLKCPKCDQIIPWNNNSSRNMHIMSYSATCKTCKIGIEINMPVDGICVRFEDKPLV